MKALTYGPQSKHAVRTFWAAANSASEIGCTHKHRNADHAEACRKRLGLSSVFIRCIMSDGDVFVNTEVAS